MRPFRAFTLVSALLVLVPGGLLAETGSHLSRQPRLAARSARGGLTPSGQRVAQAAAFSYSVQLNIVTRVTGQSFYRTAVDITNNTATDGVIASYQYCFTLSGVYQNCTTSAAITLHPYDSFHTDDIVDYMGQQGLVPPAAAASSFGTFIVTFDGLPSNNGWEGTVLGRTYNDADNADPAAGTVAIAYPASLFFESATGSLVAIVRDTTHGDQTAGALRTNLGVTNTALYDFQNPVHVRVSFFDTATGLQVGGVLTPTHPLGPGEVFQFSNVWATAGIPSTVESCIAFVDITDTQSPTTPFTIEGYVDVLDGGTNDGAYYEFKCAAGCANFQ